MSNKPVKAMSAAEYLVSVRGLTVGRSSVHGEAEITDKMSAKGWRERSSRSRTGYTVRMVKAYSFAHSLEVLFAKSSLREVRASLFDLTKKTSKPPDNRAMILLRSKLIQKLNGFNRRLTNKKAFFRWYLHSKLSIPRMAIEKIAINARINHLIATYRFIRIGRVGLSRDKEHKHLYEGLELTDNVVNKLYDKYNTRLTVLEQAFNRIKDNYIRCSKLLRLETVVAKVIERRRWKNAFFQNVQRLSRLKVQIISRIQESCRSKVATAFCCLRTTVYDYMSGLLQESKTKTDFQIIQKIFENKLKQQMSQCLKQVRQQRERHVEGHEILGMIFEHHLRMSFKNLTQKKSKMFDKLHTLVSLLERIKRRHLTIGQDALHRVIVEEEVETITVRSPTAPTPSSASMIRFIGPGTPQSKAAGFSGFLTKSKVSNRPEIIADSRRKAFDALIRILRLMEYKRKSSWWLSFEIFTRIKKYRIAKNFFKKWAIKMFGERAKFKWIRAAKIMKFNHIIRTAMFRHSMSDLKASLKVLHTNAFLDYQIKKAISFKTSVPIIKVLLGLENRKKKQGLYAISFVSEISKSLVNIRSVFGVLKAAGAPNGDPAVEVAQPTSPASPLLRLESSVLAPKPSVVKIDQVAMILQSQRVRRRQVNPIMTDFAVAESPRHRKGKKQQNLKSRSVSREPEPPGTRGFGSFSAAADSDQNQNTGSVKPSKYRKVLLMDQDTDNTRANVLKRLQKEDRDYDCISKSRNANMLRNLEDFDSQVIDEFPRSLLIQEIKQEALSRITSRVTSFRAKQGDQKFVKPQIDTSIFQDQEAPRNMFARSTILATPQANPQLDDSQAKFGPNFAKRSSKGAETIRLALESLGDRAKDILSENQSSTVSPGPINPIILSPNGARSKEIGKTLRNGVLNIQEARQSQPLKTHPEPRITQKPQRPDPRSSKLKLKDFGGSDSEEQDDYNVYHEQEELSKSVTDDKPSRRDYYQSNPRDAIASKQNFLYKQPSSSLRASPKQPERNQDSEGKLPLYRRQNSGLVSSPTRSTVLKTQAIPSQHKQIQLPFAQDSQNPSRKESAGDGLMASSENSPGKLSMAGTHRLPEPKVTQSVENLSQSKADGENSYMGEFSMKGSSRRMLQLDPQPTSSTAGQRPPSNIGGKAMGSKITAAMALLNSKSKPK